MTTCRVFSALMMRAATRAPFSASSRQHCRRGASCSAGSPTKKETQSASAPSNNSRSGPSSVCREGAQTTGNAVMRGGRRRGYGTVVASGAATTPPGGGVVDREAHDAEQAALRDEMVAGCTECTMPMEADRAVTLASAALNGRTAADLGEGSSLRVLVVGAETGKLAAALVSSGASHVLVIDHSQVGEVGGRRRETRMNERTDKSTYKRHTAKTFSFNETFIFLPESNQRERVRVQDRVRNNERESKRDKARGTKRAKEREREALACRLCSTAPPKPLTPPRAPWETNAVSVFSERTSPPWPLTKDPLTLSSSTPRWRRRLTRRTRCAARRF